MRPQSPAWSRPAAPRRSSPAARAGAACPAPGSATTRTTVGTARTSSACPAVPRSSTSAPAGSCGPPCGAGEFGCAAGRCLPYLHRCDGHDDCGDFSDERECVCPPGDFQCPDALCLPPALVCDGKRDCPAGTDEAFCPGEPLVHRPAWLLSPHAGLPPCCAGATHRPEATTPSPGLASPLNALLARGPGCRPGSLDPPWEPSVGSSERCQPARQCASPCAGACAGSCPRPGGSVRPGSPSEFCLLQAG
uniref:Uncharacterized protein n=1 Tax=Terrapene triunguis TaxID=2587831 RepID=A0A674JD37_9SAUR